MGMNAQWGLCQSPDPDLPITSPDAAANELRGSSRRPPSSDFRAPPFGPRQTQGRELPQEEGGSWVQQDPLLVARRQDRSQPNAFFCFFKRQINGSEANEGVQELPLEGKFQRRNLEAPLKEI